MNCVRVWRIVNKFEIFYFHINCVKCVEEWNIWQSKQNQNSYTIWTLNGKFTSNSQLLQSKPLLDWLFNEIVKNLFFSSNTHPNWMGLVSLCPRREILSYELKFIFSSFCQNFIVRAWIWGCSTHVHQVWEIEKLWLTLELKIKFKTHPCAYSSLQKDFTTCKFRAISLWPFTSPQACSWWIFKRS